MSAPLTLTGIQSADIDIRPDAFASRDAALNAARLIQTVTDSLDAEWAAEALKAVTALARDVEACRTEIKAPVLSISRRIDETAKTFVADLLVERDRLNRLLGEYQLAERNKADSARREAQAEADRLAREAAQAARLAERATNDGQAEQAQQVAAAAEVAAVQARVAVAEIKPVNPDGVLLRLNWKYEVTDIKELWKARPDLCLIEPNAAAIRAQIPHNQSIPGLRVWSEAKASVKI